MEINWNNKEPIYLQLRDRLVELIMDGLLLEGDALPSVRQISSEQRINPITVSKAFQMLVDEELVEKKRGLGMYVVTGAKDKLARQEKIKFLNEEWPQIEERIERLGLGLDDLLGRAKK
ncbi:MAG TPA: GntR family transcriptional regulator [Gammaproteobacteria bacterium]|nr:GntR family transcriptional regulator [Gammaproteobacteria bacterium]MDP6732506.1 GntR family transcriptional regulator [Gammaproteobacteria bacterium]HAJ77082.1 GntR family transcriptional regulator [Gammaproteobacteria bacterium]